VPLFDATDLGTVTRAENQVTDLGRRMTLNTSSHAQRIMIRCQKMDALMTSNSGEIVCTTNSGCPTVGFTSSEIDASPTRPHFGQLRIKAILA
jgi:hypothetical protein